MKKFLIALLAACVLSAGAEAASKFTFGDTTFNPENAEPDTNPHRDYSGWACIRYGIGETLFRYSDTMEVEPWLAEGFELVNDTTWRIKLRDGVSFTSGRKLDAQAVKECIEHLTEVHGRARNDLDIASIEADGLTLIIRTNTPKPALLNCLSDPYGCIIDMHAGITEDGQVSATGPYKSVSVLSGERAELVKNENYWNGEPGFDEITVLTISDGDTLTMALRAGELDAAYGMPYASYPLFMNDDYTFSSSATSRAFFVWMNFDSPLTSDPAVRKAIAMGINKDGFVKTLLQGNGYTGHGVFPSGFALGGDKVAADTYDPDGARKLLDDAGWRAGANGIRERDGRQLRLRWLTYPSRQELPLLAESAQATLRDIGIDVVINSTPDHNSIRGERSAWDIYASAMVTAPTGDPEYFFTTCCLDKSAVNVGRYHSDKLEDLAAKMAVTFDPKERAETGLQMQQTILDDNAYVFCSFLRMTMISRRGIVGLTAHPCDFYEITAALKEEF